jgi:hypothetical protein
VVRYTGQLHRLSGSRLSCTSTTTPSTGFPGDRQDGDGVGAVLRGGDVRELPRFEADLLVTGQLGGEGRILSEHLDERLVELDGMR